jgi:HAD superfamily phosphoserine phosphatase-like hydrolase
MRKSLFHINPKTGNITECRARKDNCPFGTNSVHFTDRESAQNFFEDKMREIACNSHRKRIVLTDVDGTIIRSSFVLTNAADLHDSGDVDLGEAPNDWRQDMKNEDKVTQLAINYQQSIVGQDVAFVRAKDTVKKIMASRENFYSTLDQLIEYKQKGYEVVLITGSPDFLVKPFADKFGFKYCSSVYHKDETGKFTGEITLMAGSKAKKKAIDGLNIDDYDEIIGIGDTASDIPILEVAHQKILVDPTQETLDEFKKRNIQVDSIIHN